MEVANISGHRIARRLYGVFLELLWKQGLFAIFVAAPVAPALAEVDDSDISASVVVVNVYDGKTLSRSGSGYVVHAGDTAGYVITSAALAGAGGSLTVQTPGDSAELVASLVTVGSAQDLAVLKVNGLGLRPLTFSAGLPQPGDIVWTAVKWSGGNSPVGLTKGSLRKAWSDNGTGLLTHSASVGSRTPGSVLLNDCGQVIGFNLSSPDANGIIQAIDGATLQTILGAEEIPVNAASTACVSEVAAARAQAAEASAAAKRATEEAARAQKVAHDLEQRLQASNKTNDSLVAQTRAARERADEAMKKAEVAHQNAESTRAELEKKTASIVAQTQAMMKSMQDDNVRAETRFQRALSQQRSETATREAWLVGIGVALLVGLLGFMIFSRYRSPAAPVRQEEPPRRPHKPVPAGNTELHNQELSEYVLDGRDEDGIRYLLRISGDQLLNPDGVVIGRNPQDSPYIINHADVSRKHARMKVMKNRVFIEDLGSTNGTSVNGQSIDEKGPVAVVNGDQIIIGSVVMKLRVLGG